MKAVGLYDPAYEHDSCGVAFVARLDGVASHETLVRAATALANLEHRGAEGADALTGDGAGMTLQLPDALFRAEIGAALPPLGSYGVAVCFLPRDAERAAALERLLAETVEAEGQTVVAWRDVPVDERHAGASAAATAPLIRQLFVAAAPGLAADDFERKLYVIRRVAELAAGPDLVIPSFSARTVVYKGMLTAPQLTGYYPDLRDERTASALVLVHSRYSTNTFPSWELAHPYRMIAHNGEINTLRGNVNWMSARESQLASELFGDDLAKILPVVRPGGSDSATFDNVLELLVLAGRSLPHAMMMMIPEAYQGREDISPELAGFYAYHQCLMEAWDGPAAIAFTDGRVIGATLDRNGLRPGRWLETADGWVILASETGVLEEAPENIVRKGRLQPGKLFLVDVESGRIVPDEEVKRTVASRRPYAEWYRSEVVRLEDLPERENLACPAQPLRTRQLAFGYTQDDMKVILAPLARNAEEAIGSMGNDLPLAVLSDRRPVLYSYFKQLFAQVTNPPIDSIREAVVMSVEASVGSERNLLDETPEHARQLVIANPILRDEELERLRQIDSDVFHAHTIDTTWPVADGPEGLELAVERICAEADEALAGRREHHRPLRSRRRARAGAGSVAPRGLRPAPPPRARRHAAAGRADRRVRRAAQRAERGRARRLRSCRREPVPDARDARRARRSRSAAARHDEGRGAAPRDQGDRQGTAEDDLEDGHLDDPVVLRRPGLRGDRALARARRPSLHRHRLAHRRDRDRGARRATRLPATRAPTRARTTGCCP